MSRAAIGKRGRDGLSRDGLSLRKDAALPFRRVLIANRGEIAVRIIKACRELGLETVAVYSDADAHAAHARLADVAVRIGRPPPMDSYLNVDAILAAANATRADAIHPGYGFLSERASFARAAIAAGLVFVGPAPEAIELLGDKLRARELARSAGVPIVPGTLSAAAIDRAQDLPRLVEVAQSIGFPLLVKAAAGGGGRGMRRVTRAADLPVALVEGSREAASAFGDGRVYLEREILPARHIEVQLLGDTSGRVVALGERDCSIQRRHQKLVEEAPAPGITAAERRRLHELAIAVGTAAGLTNAATAEFLRSPDGAYYFLEVNTRLQVEHGVTELATGVDIVREQFTLAAGRTLSKRVQAAAKAAKPEGHAIEVRISAEDPGRDFAPTPGLIRHWVMPQGSGIRVDTAVTMGERIPPEYDNLLAKVMVHAPDRDMAITLLSTALADTEIAGIQTTLPFHRHLAQVASFRRGELSTGWVAEHWDGPAAAAAAGRCAQIGAALAIAAGEDAAAIARTAGARASDAGTPGVRKGGGIPGIGAPDLSARRSDAGGWGNHSGEPATWSEVALEKMVDRWPTS